MQEAVEEVVKRFHAQMDSIPQLSLYDSDKGVALEIPREKFKTYITCTEEDKFILHYSSPATDTSDDNKTIEVNYCAHMTSLLGIILLYDNNSCMFKRYYTRFVVMLHLVLTAS